MNLTDLKEKPIQDLVEMAQKIGIENVGRLRKQDIIFTILKDHSSNGEDISGGNKLKEPAVPIGFFSVRMETFTFDFLFFMKASIFSDK